MTRLIGYHIFIFLVLCVYLTAVPEVLKRHIQIYFQIIICFLFSNFSLHESFWFTRVSDTELWTKGCLVSVIRSVASPEGGCSLQPARPTGRPCTHSSIHSRHCFLPSPQPSLLLSSNTEFLNFSTVGILAR